MSESPEPRSSPPLINRKPFDASMLSNNHLTDSLAIIHDEILIGKVDQNDTNFAAIIGINRTGRV
jgi:hypothetical protein